MFSVGTAKANLRTWGPESGLPAYVSVLFSSGWLDRACKKKPCGFGSDFRESLKQGTYPLFEMTDQRQTNFWALQNLVNWDQSFPVIYGCHLGTRCKVNYTAFVQLLQNV